MKWVKVPVFKSIVLSPDRENGRADNAEDKLDGNREEYEIIERLCVL